MDFYFYDGAHMNHNATHVFQTFPHFSKLELSDKQRYEHLIETFPVIAEMSFATLLTWWNSLESCRVSQLNGNLIISYWLPGDERNSGLSIAGRNNIDETICAIFDHQRERKEQPRLVHVPEFVMSNMRYPEMYSFTPEDEYDEWVLSVANLSTFKGMNKYLKTRAKRFLSQVDEDDLIVRTLDLGHTDNQRLLKEAYKNWLRPGNFNDVAPIDVEAFSYAVEHTEELDIRNICLYHGKKLVGFQFYQLPADKRYVIATFNKVDCDMQGIAEYMFYISAKHFSELGASYINYELDLGIQRLRGEKLALGPVRFMRKYTVKPLT